MPMSPRGSLVIPLGRLEKWTMSCRYVPFWLAKMDVDSGFKAIPQRVPTIHPVRDNAYAVSMVME
jgi:hypothetical protein